MTVDPSAAERRKALAVLAMNTLAFTVCFACWMTNGVLITFLVEQGVYSFSKSEIGWLIGIPVLTGSIVRLPVGIWTDKYGGRPVFFALLLVCAVPMWLLSYADSYTEFFIASLGFGLAGTGFAVGIAYTSVWFPKQQQGTALGIFGVGNAGAALTSMGAPFLLRWLTSYGADPEGWRAMPKIYAAALVGMAIVFWIFTYPKRVTHSEGKTLGQRLEPLKHMRVWRFGLYYFLVFGGFVALAQWLIPYYVSAYAVPVTLAGLLAAVFSLPSGVIRALGGWISDRYGARTTMYWVLGSCLICSALLVVPRMDIESPGQGVLAGKAGKVTELGRDYVKVGEARYAFTPDASNGKAAENDNLFLVLPRSSFWQTPVVEPGQEVAKKQLLAKGTTHVYFQANVWIFTLLVFVVGIMMGIGKAAVYKYIPDYFPNDVGVVGGLVGLIGGLGGFFCPVIFGYLLEWTGIWTTCWVFFAALSAVCLLWLHVVVRRIERREAPQLNGMVDEKNGPVSTARGPSVAAVAAVSPAAPRVGGG